jgi:uncharacterized NAD(P)/FAD-binding protein YdhS
VAVEKWRRRERVMDVKRVWRRYVLRRREKDGQNWRDVVDETRERRSSARAKRGAGAERAADSSRISRGT